MPENFTVRKLTRQLWDHGHDPSLYAGDDYKFWTMTPNLWCKDFMGSRIDLDFVRRQMEMDHVRWDEPVDCWRSEIKDSIKSP